MKKVLAIVIFAALLMLSVPGLAQAAGNQSKQEFINNYINAMSQSAQMNKAMYEGIKANTVNLSLKGTLRDTLVVMPDGTRMTNIPGYIDVAISFNLAAQKGSCRFDVNIKGEKVKGAVYLYNQNVIIPRETYESLYRMDDFLFDEPEDLPSYIIEPIPAEDWQLLFKSLNQSIDSGSKQTEAVMDLIKEILNLLPDSCYSYVNDKPVLKLDLKTITSKEFLTNLKNDSSVLAGKISVVLDNAAPQTGDTAMYKETKEDIIDGINQINPDEVQKAMKDCPVTVKDCTLTASPGSLDQSVDVEISDSGDAVRIALQSQSQIASANVSSKTLGQINAKVDQDDFKVDVNAATTMDFARFSQNYDLALKGNFEGSNVSGKANMTLNMDWSSKNAIDIPALTPENSKVLDEPEYNDDDWEYFEPYHDSDTIYIHIDGEDFNFGHNQPIIIDGHTMVPLRDLADYMGCDVEWQPGSPIKIINDDESVTMNLNSKKYYVGAQEKQLDVSPMMVNGHTYVPVTFFADYFDYEIEWDGEMNTVYLSDYNY